MQNRDVLDRQMTRRLLLGAAGMGGLAFLPAPARAEETVDLQFGWSQYAGDHVCFSAERTDDSTADEYALARNPI